MKKNEKGDMLEKTNIRNKMAQKEMHGRLGNQFFQYAAMKGILKKIKSEEPISLNFSKRVYVKQFKNDLTEFKINPYQEVDKMKPTFVQSVVLTYMKGSERIIKLFCGKKDKEKILYAYEKKMANLLTKFGIYFMRQGYYDFKSSKAKDKIFVGQFESAKYFDNVREELLEEFTPKQEKLEKNLEIYDAIEKSESVCVTIRRGDYLTEENKKEFYVCTPEYFNQAIEVIKQKVEHPKFFIFSDDITWVKENMNFPEDSIFETGNDPVWEKLRMMYSCKHFIISNSTFSWWAQYLSRNDKKVVVAPSKWRNKGLWNDIYQENWTIIEIEKEGRKQ